MQSVVVETKFIDMATGGSTKTWISYQCVGIDECDSRSY